MSWNSKDVYRFFESHWTVRRYKYFKMPKDHLDILMYSAQRAPTDATAQMYSFIRVVAPELKAKVAELSANAHMETASETFVVCADVRRLKLILATRGDTLAETPNIHVHFAIGDAVMAGQNLLIAAEMLGYKGCWIGGVLTRLEEVSHLLELPEGVFPFAGLTVGVPDEPPMSRPRLPRDQVFHEDRYRDPSDEDLKKGIAGMAAITARGDWAQTLARYFAQGGTMETREKTLTAYLDRQLSRTK